MTLVGPTIFGLLEGTSTKLIPSVPLSSKISSSNLTTLLPTHTQLSDCQMAILVLSTYSYSNAQITMLIPLLPSLLLTGPCHPTGHGIHICKISRNPPVAASPDDIVSAQIPSQIFDNPPSHSNNPTVSPAIRQLPALERSFLSLSHPTTSKVKATIWAWWHSVGQPQTPVSSNPHHFNLLSRKLGRAKGQLVTLPSASWTWLPQHFPGIPSDGFHIVRDHYILVSVPLLSDLLVKYELLHPSHFTGPSCTQFTIPPLATWTKCRVAAPKIWAHQGAIKSADGTIYAPLPPLLMRLSAPHGPFGRTFLPLTIQPRLPYWRTIHNRSHQFPLVNHQVTMNSTNPLLHRQIPLPVRMAFRFLPGACPPRFLPEPSSTTLIQYYICRQHRPYSPWCSFLKQIKATTPITTGPSACPTLATVSLTGPLTLSLHLA